MSKFTKALNGSIPYAGAAAIGGGATYHGINKYEDEYRSGIYPWVKGTMMAGGALAGMGAVYGVKRGSAFVGRKTKSAVAAQKMAYKNIFGQ